MIERLNSFYYLVCDVCGEEAEEQFFDFFEVVDYKKKYEWKSKKRNSEWEDICPECQQEGE